ncbi:Uncharacterised protein [Mycobacteroides abscessus subsp. abscessus]|nr:Uncharacterised protein [Mycobacteroides abscessus subsp. abscessus]
MTPTTPTAARWEYRVTERPSLGRSVWPLQRRLITADGHEFPWRETVVYHNRQRAEADAEQLNAEQP